MRSSCGASSAGAAQCSIQSVPCRNCTPSASGSCHWRRRWTKPRPAVALWLECSTYLPSSSATSCGKRQERLSPTPERRGGPTADLQPSLSMSAQSAASPSTRMSRYLERYGVLTLVSQPRPLPGTRINFLMQLRQPRAMPSDNGANCAGRHAVGRTGFSTVATGDAIVWRAALVDAVVRTLAESKTAAAPEPGSKV